MTTIIRKVVVCTHGRPDRFADVELCDWGDPKYLNVWVIKAGLLRGSEFRADNLKGKGNNAYWIKFLD